ncbi:hypothetical protein Tco_0734067 [Tanacetum coccineum]
MERCKNILLGPEMDRPSWTFHGLFLTLARVSVTKLATSRLVNGSSCDGVEMVIKNLDFEPKIDAMMSPSRWKELSKETSSKILPCGDGSRWKTFKPVASLIAMGKLK